MAKRAKTLSEKIRAAIHEDGRPLLQIAHATGVDYGGLYRFAHGQRGLSLENLDRVFDALGLDVVKRGAAEGT